MALLNVDKLTKYYGAELIFRNVSFQVVRGEKVALVGANGSGKSTLLKIIAGMESPEAGGAQLSRGTSVAYQAQEGSASGRRTLWQEMEAALAHLSALQEEIGVLEQRLEDTSAPDWRDHIHSYGELTARFEHAGGYHIERNIKRTLQGLGFVESQYHHRLSELSGGQRTRAALAAALLSDPDLLLLDEPTNHLDLEAMEWLDGFLKTWPGTLIVVSHDRHFLEKVTGRTLELAFGGLEDYPASYNRYVQLKSERLERRMKEYAAQQELIARTEEFIRRYGAGQRAREAKGREKRLDRLKEQNLIERPKEPGRVKLFLDAQLRSGDLALFLDRLEVGFKGPAPSPTTSAPIPEPKLLFRTGRLELRRGERVALVGPNGSGKTTLLRTIVGEVPALDGHIRLGHNVTIGYYAQGHEALNPDGTLLDEIWRADPALTETQARSLLGRFLFSGDDVFKLVRDLSGGERSRVALAQLTELQSNLLVMDEPTNHLDIDAREALEAVLKEYNGSILFVSHDRYFIDALADKVWLVERDALSEHLGNYSNLVARSEKERQLANALQAKSLDRPAKGNGHGGNSSNGATARAEARRAASEERQQRKRVAALESELLRLEQDMAELKANLESASTALDVALVTSLGTQYVALEETYNARYKEWAEMAEAIE